MSIKTPGVKFAALFAVVLAMAIPSGVALADHPDDITRTAVISDGSNPGDTLTITIEDVPSALAGATLEGWLVTDNADWAVSTGKMSADAEGNVSHTYVSPTGDNLVAGFDKFLVSVEPVPDPAEEYPSGVFAFSARIDRDVMGYIRFLLVSWPPGSETGVVDNLRAQLEIAIVTGEMASTATSLMEMKMHAQRLINVIEGSKGANYIRIAGNPGDGVGIMTHVNELGFAAYAAGEDPENETLAKYASMVAADAANIEARVEAARDAAYFSLQRNDVLGARLDLIPVSGLLNSALNGLDANVDGIIESGGEEGGAHQAYVDAQGMATYVLEEGELEPLAPEFGIGLSRTGGIAASYATMIALAAAAILAIGAGAFVLGRRRTRTDR